MTNLGLIQKAREVTKFAQTSDDVAIGEVGAALITDKGNLYVGTSINAECGVGFCAESSAIAAMVTKQESRIVKIVAVNDHAVVSPCGRCREIIFQINYENMGADVVLAEDKMAKLKDLLPGRQPTAAGQEKE